MTVDDLQKAFGLEVVNPPPAGMEITGRMAKGGYLLSTFASTVVNGRTLYSLKFFKEGETPIHVTGYEDIAQLYEAALREAHRRYRARVSAPVQ